MSLREVNICGSGLQPAFESARQSEGAIKSILLVGAFCDSSGRLENSDREYLEASLTWLKLNLNRTPSKRPTISVSNIEYGSDFFLEDGQYDLIVLCSLLFSREAMHSMSVDRATHQSDLAFDPQNWKTAIERIKPKALTNIYLTGHPSGYKINDVVKGIMPHVSDGERFGAWNTGISGFSFDKLA